MEYRAITNENFYQNEFKNLCRFMMKNTEVEDLKESLREEDILDTTTENNFKRKFIALNKRLAFLNEELMKYVVTGDSSISRFINLYTLICCERILLEFMDEVVREKFESYDYYIKETEFRRYIEYKGEQSDIVDNWSEESKKKIVVKLKNFLIEGGYLIKEDERYRIIKPLILPEIIDEIKKSGRKGIAKAMLY